MTRPLLGHFASKVATPSFLAEYSVISGNPSIPHGHSCDRYHLNGDRVKSHRQMTIGLASSGWIYDHRAQLLPDEIEEEPGGAFQEMEIGGYQRRPDLRVGDRVLVILYFPSG